MAVCSQWLARWKSWNLISCCVLFCVPEAASFGDLPARPWLTSATSLDQRALEKDLLLLKGGGHLLTLPLCS